MENSRTQKYSTLNFKNSLDGLKSRKEKTEEILNKGSQEQLFNLNNRGENTLRKELRASESCGTMRKYLTFMSSEMQKEGREKMALQEIVR